MSETCPNSEFKDDRHDWITTMLPKHKTVAGECLEVCYRCMAFRVRLARASNDPGAGAWFTASGTLVSEEATPSA